LTKKSSSKRLSSTLECANAFAGQVLARGLSSKCQGPCVRWALASQLLHCNASHCNTLQHTATHCNKLQRTATHGNTLQHTTTLCNTLQHTATHCNTLQEGPWHLTQHEQGSFPLTGQFQTKSSQKKRRKRMAPLRYQRESTPKSHMCRCERATIRVSFHINFTVCTHT